MGGGQGRVGRHGQRGRQAGQGAGRQGESEAGGTRSLGEGKGLRRPSCPLTPIDDHLTCPVPSRRPRHRRLESVAGWSWS